MKWFIRLIILFILFGGMSYAIFQLQPDLSYSTTPSDNISKRTVYEDSIAPKASSSPSVPLDIPPQFLIQNDYHIFQTFNNCGPAALSMALSYFGIDIAQGEIGADTSPVSKPSRK
jgi:hypothetical protein